MFVPNLADKQSKLVDPNGKLRLPNTPHAVLLSRPLHLDGVALGAGSWHILTGGGELKDETGTGARVVVTALKEL